jgi:hypothetical protein
LAGGARVTVVVKFGTAAADVVATVEEAGSSLRYLESDSPGRMIGSTADVSA